MLEVQGPRTQRGVAGGNKRLQSKQTDDESSLFEVKVVLEQVVRRRRNNRASVLEVHKARAQRGESVDNNGSNQDRPTTSQAFSRWRLCGCERCRVEYGGSGQRRGKGRETIVRGIDKQDRVSTNVWTRDHVNRVTDDYLLAYALVWSEPGSDQVLKIGGPSEPQTRPMVRFTHRHEPWTEPWSGLAGFGFEPRF